MMPTLLWSSLGVAALLCACSARGSEPQAVESSVEPVQTTTPSTQASQALPTGELEKFANVRRDFVAEAGRAELVAGGLLIDVGTLDMHKYSRGGWLSGWGRNQLDGETTIARTQAATAWLDVDVPEGIKEIVVRAKGGRLGVAVDGGAVARKALQKDYAVIRVPLKTPAEPGRHRIRLLGRNTAIDWVWLSESIGAEPPSLARTLPIGPHYSGALIAPTARTYRFYLDEQAEDSELRFQVGGVAGTQVRVVVERDGLPPLMLFSETLGEQEIAKNLSLTMLTSAPSRLSFQSSGGAASWTDPRISTPAIASGLPLGNPRNLIVLLIDTQRADSFSPYSKGKGIGAKAFEELAAHSSVFTNAYNNENWTKPSIATIDTGLYPTTHTARWRKDRCSSDLVFLSEHLQDLGFTTQAMVSNISAGPKFGFDQGWGSFIKTDNAEHAFGKATEWLDSRDPQVNARDPDKRFFLYLQTIDPHVPFVVPQGSTAPFYKGTYQGKLGPSFEQSEEDALNDGKMKLSADDAAWLQALYNAEVMYHDDHLGRFVTAMKERGLFDDTALVILNDHGEEFGEHGRFGHGWTMGDAMHRSPLLMHMPDYFPSRHFTEVVEHVDIAATLLEVLGLQGLPTSEGRSLVPLVFDDDHHNTDGHRPYSALLFGRPKRRAIRVGRFKLVLQGPNKQQLFDIETDPGQTRDLLKGHGIATRLCEVSLGEAIANPAKSTRLADRSKLLKVVPEYIKE